MGDAKYTYLTNKYQANFLYLLLDLQARFSSKCELTNI